MSQMNPVNASQISHTIHGLRGLALIFGICLGILVISSFRDSAPSSENAGIEHVDVSTDFENTSEQGNFGDTDLQLKELKPKTHHNFIASYLLQESSIHRKNLRSDEGDGFINNLRQIHKNVIVRVLDLL